MSEHRIVAAHQYGKGNRAGAGRSDNTGVVKPIFSGPLPHPIKEAPANKGQRPFSRQRQTQRDYLDSTTDVGLADSQEIMQKPSAARWGRSLRRDEAEPCGKLSSRYRRLTTYAVALGRSPRLMLLACKKACACRRLSGSGTERDDPRLCVVVSIDERKQSSYPSGDFMTSFSFCMALTRLWLAVLKAGLSPSSM